MTAQIFISYVKRNPDKNKGFRKLYLLTHNVLAISEDKEQKINEDKF